MNCVCCGWCCCCGATYIGDCTCFAETRDDDAVVAKSARPFVFGKTCALGAAALPDVKLGDCTCCSLRFQITFSGDLSSLRSQPCARCGSSSAWWSWCSTCSWWWWWSLLLGNHSDIHTGPGLWMQKFRLLFLTIRYERGMGAGIYLNGWDTYAIFSSIQEPAEREYQLY